MFIDIHNTDKKYNIIYADPPWKYRAYSKKGLGRSAESHYPTMSIEDICSLPVEKIADRDSVLFMWVTFPTLKEALKVIEAWGFEYKTAGFVWIKQNKKNTDNVLGYGLLDESQCRIMYYCNKRTSKTQICRCASGNHVTN